MTDRDTDRNSARRKLRAGRFLLGGSVLAAALTGANPALAQVNATGTEVFGTAGINTSGSITTVTIDPTKTEALVDWAATDADVFLPDGSTLAFDSTGGAFTVLNRIAPVAATTNPLAINGAVTATSGNGSGSVWFYNPNGFIIGATSSFDVNGLVLTASPITVDTTTETLFGANGEVIFGQTPNPGASVTFAPGAISLTQAGSYLAVVAPRIVQSADINVNGSVAYVAAEAATISVNGGLFDITVDVGTTDENGIVHTGNTYGDQPSDSTTRQYLVAVPKNDVLTMLVSGSLGYLEASAVSVNDGRIVLSAGYDIVGGEASGAGTPGASIEVDNLYTRSAMDASATDTIKISDTTNTVDLYKTATFTAGNLIDIDIGFQDFIEGSNLYADELILNSAGDIDINLFGGFTDIFGSLAATAQGTINAVIDGGSLYVNNDLTLTSVVTGTGGVTSGDVALSVGVGSIDAYNINLASIAYSDGTATGGTVTLATTDPDAYISTIDTVNVWSLGFGISGNSDGATGIGGTAQVLVQGGTMNLGIDSGSLVTLDIRADGGPGVGLDAAGISGSAQGGTALLDVSGGDLIADGISVSASGLSYALVFDEVGDLVPEGFRQTGDGTTAFGGNATVSLSAGSISSLGFVEGTDIAILATGYGGSAFGSASAFGTGGTGQGGTAQFLQTGGTAEINFLTADASGMGGAGSDESAKSVAPAGIGGAGNGGTALVQLSGGTTTLGGGINVLAEGNPFRVLDPVFGTQAGQGGTATSGAGGAGGTGTGGDASLIIDGGSLEAGLDGNGAAVPTTVLISANGYGGLGGYSDPGFAAVDGGAGGTGQGGTALFEYSGGTNEAENLVIQAAGLGGQGGGDLSGGDSGLYGGADGGAGFGGTATFLALADYDTTALGTGFDQQVTVNADGSGADGSGADAGSGGNGGNGTGGDASIIAEGADLAMSAFDLYADGFAGSGGSGGNDGVVTAGGSGGAGEGGNIRIAALNGGSFTDLSGFSSLTVEGNGGNGGKSSADVGGAGGGGIGGSVTLDALGGTITLGNVLISATGNAGEGGFGATFGADGMALGGSIDISATIVGGDIGSLQAGSLTGYAAGWFVESTVAAGTITLTDMTSGTVSFDSLLFDNGYDAGTADGSITVTSTLNPITVAGAANFYTAGDLLFQVGGGGGFVAGTLNALATGNIRFVCLSASCIETVEGTNDLYLETDLGLTSSGLDFGSDGETQVFVNGGDLTLTGGATIYGTPLSVNVFGTGDGSFLGNGSLLSGGDIAVYVGVDMSVDSIVGGGSILVSSNSLTSTGTVSAPLGINVYTSLDQSYATLAAGQDVYLFAFPGAVTTADLTVGGIAYFDALSLDIGSSGSLAVGGAYAYGGDIAITSAGDLTVDYAEATGDILLTSTGASVTATSLYAGSDLLNSMGSGSQGLQAVAIASPGAGNIAIDAATDVNLLDTASAPEQLGIDAGGTVTIDGLAAARLIAIRSAGLVFGQGAQLGDLAVTEDISLVALGDAAIGGGVASPGYLIDPVMQTQILSNGDFSLAANGSLTVGDFTAFAGDGLIGSAGNLFLTGGTGLTVLGNVLLESADLATLVMRTSGDLYINSSTGSVRVQSNGVQAGSLFLFSNRVIAGSSQTLSDIATLPFADLTDALGTVDGGDGRSLIEGGSLLVDAGEFYVVNTGADTSFDARRGILANSMTITNSGGAFPYVVINGVVDGRYGLDTAFGIDFPLSAAPSSSVNGCYIGFGGACGSTIDIELVKKIITEEPPHSVLDGEPRSTIETRIISIEKIEPEGFEPLIDEPVTGTGNDDLWEEKALDGSQCPTDLTRDECEKAAAE